MVRNRCELFLAVSSVLLGLSYSLEGSLTIDYFDEEILFEVAWPGAGSGEKLPHVPPSVDVGLPTIPLPIDDSSSVVASDEVHKLPNQLLGRGDYHGGSVVLTTADREVYRCTLPYIYEAEEAVDEVTYNELYSPRVLLAPLVDKCTKLVMAYWNYELCHGFYLRQFHEDKAPNGQVKKTEYFLGRTVLESEVTTATEDEEAKGKVEEIPTWHYNGMDYPYYEVRMTDGTACDLRNNVPRSIKILYICEKDSHPTGNFIHIEEVSTCRYEAVISTSQLCKNKDYRLKENPVHSIECFAEGDSPGRPRIVLEHALFSSILASKGVYTPTKDAYGAPLQKESKVSPIKYKPSPIGIPSSFVQSFVKGQACLRGGSGWWEHEICFRNYVKQIHSEPKGVKDEVLLGLWEEETHKEWFSKAGKRKQSKTHVTHLYVNGDECDVTGVPRTCQVRFKCVQSHAPSQVSLYLEEPTTCSYTLTVEAQFICSLLELTDEYGIFRIPSEEEEDTSEEDEDMILDEEDE